MNLKTVMLVLGMTSAAQAETVCKDYVVKGNLSITQFCADQISAGTYENPRMIDDSGKAWPVGPGFNSENRSARLCRILEGKKEAVSYRLKMGSKDQLPVSLGGCYAFRGKFADYEQFDQIVCR